MPPSVSRCAWVEPRLPRPERGGSSELELTDCIERLIDSGKLKDYAQAATTLGLTRARLTQIANLLLLAPSIQERVLIGDLRVSERSLRLIVKEPAWYCQVTLL